MRTTVDVQDWRGIWVFAEVNDGKAENVSIELIGKARELADKLETTVGAILIGEKVSHLATKLVEYGADDVLVGEDPRLADYETECFARIITGQVLAKRPEVLVFGATPLGRDLAPRVAMKLDTGCTADCTDLDVDTENRLFVSTRPAFGGNVMATILCPENRPQMSTVRPGTMKMPLRDSERKGRVEFIKLNDDDLNVRVRVVSREKKSESGSNIQEAEKIVAFGMGACDETKYQMVRELAKALGAALAGTRMAVEAGWIGHDQQVGQTGKNVKPLLYVACGISGAVQHTAGMTNSKVIVAINKDKNAEIFNFADYGIVGDVEKTIPAIIKTLNS